MSFRKAKPRICLCGRVNITENNQCSKCTDEPLR